MEDLLTPLKSVKLHNYNDTETLSLSNNRKEKHSNDNKGVTSKTQITLPSESLLTETPVTVPPEACHKRQKRYDSTAFVQQSYLQTSSTDALPDDAREILKSQPDLKDLLAVLQYLQYGVDGQHDFNIRLASAKASQIINVLVSVTLPDHWPKTSSTKLSNDDSRLKNLLTSCLSSIIGLGALLTQTKKLATAKSGTDDTSVLQDYVGVISEILHGQNAILGFLNDVVTFSPGPTHQHVTWQEFNILLGGSKVLGVVSQARAKLAREIFDRMPGAWLGDGLEYSRWLARNISFAATKSTTEGTAKMTMLSQLLKRGMSLGYRGATFILIWSPC